MDEIVDKAAGLAGDQLKNNTKSAVFTLMTVGITLAVLWYFVWPDVMTKAEGAELYKSVGRIELSVKEDKLEDVQRELWQLERIDTPDSSTLKRIDDLRLKIQRYEKEVQDIKLKMQQQGNY